MSGKMADFVDRDQNGRYENSCRKCRQQLDTILGLIQLLLFVHNKHHPLHIRQEQNQAKFALVNILTFLMI